MDFILENQSGFWLALGFALLVVELAAFGLGSGVLLFGSIGAIITGTLIWSNLLPGPFIAGVACFAVSTSLATLLLWKPLKKLQGGAKLGNDRSSDLIGHRFVLSDDINTTTHAQQKFSGIQWRVEPAKHQQAQTIAAGTQVEVAAVSVGVFYVQPVK